jgi:hypothetical protein
MDAQLLHPAPSHSACILGGYRFHLYELKPVLLAPFVMPCPPQPYHSGAATTAVAGGSSASGVRRRFQRRGGVHVAVHQLLGAGAGHRHLPGLLLRRAQAHEAQAVRPLSLLPVCLCLVSLCLPGSLSVIVPAPPPLSLCLYVSRFLSCLVSLSLPASPPLPQHAWIAS